MPRDAVEQHLIALERQKWERWNMDNIAWVESVLHDDLLSIDTTRREIIGKSESLAEIRRSETVVLDSHLSEFRVLRPTPDTAVVSYKAKAKASVKGKEYPSVAYCSSVWVNQNGRWQTVFYQSSEAGEA